MTRRAWNKGQKFPEFSGENHPNWVGNKIKYYGLHDWLKANFPKPEKCEQCGLIGQYTKVGRWNIQWAKLKDKSYERKRENFWGLCVRCHMNYDRKGIPAWNKGVSPSLETRKKMSLARKGKIPWNKGRSCIGC